MKAGRASGQDGFVAEILKFGGKKLRKTFGVVRKMWSHAAEAEEGAEATEWPEDWKVGIVAPLWKKRKTHGEAQPY